MRLVARYRLFQKAAWAVFLFYGGLMVYVTIIAHTRQSGVTKMDPAVIVQIRHKANEDAKNAAADVSKR